MYKFRNKIFIFYYIPFLETILDQLHNRAQIMKGNLGFKIMEEEVEVILQLLRWMKIRIQDMLVRRQD